MTPTVEHDRESCPLLAPSRPLGRGDVAFAIYCRLPDGRVRVPLRQEARQFCIPAQHRLCPVYRRHAAAR
jgi:hypothetical protein